MDAPEAVHEHAGDIPNGEVGSSIPGSDATTRTRAISAKDREAARFSGLLESRGLVEVSQRLNFTAYGDADEWRTSCARCR